jgi:prepilin-type N-terminal cleavage/methylation domain-containing protein
MPTDRAEHAVRLPRGRRSAGDEGYSLIEVLVSLVVMGTVMAAVGPFLVRSLAISNLQRSTQAGIQVANDALERVRGLDPSSLLTGRGDLATDAQWKAAPAALSSYLDSMKPAASPMLPVNSTDGAQAPLPTVPIPLTINGVAYEQRFYVGLCWQTKVLVLAIGDCSPTVGLVPFFRVVVAVTWKHRACPAGSCIYVASTLVSKGADPVFDIKRPPPTVVDPLSQATYVSTAADLQIVSAGGRLPLTWTATGLPPGLTMSSSARITGTPTTVGTYTVRVQVTDRDAKSDDSTFTWTIVAPPALTSPGTQTSRTGTAVTLSVPVTGGLPPLTWAATGLPTGLIINPLTGAITGTPLTAQTVTTTVTVSDTRIPVRTASVSFSWRVLTPVTMVNPGPQSMTNGINVGTFIPYAAGGLKPYTWRAQNLPAGLTMNASTGSVTGIVQQGTRYVVTVWVTDSAGGEAMMTVVCNVIPSSTTDLRVTSPAPAAPDRTTVAGTAVSFTATAGGPTAPSYAWTAAGLPPGVTMTSGGTVSGTPTTKGTYIVSLTVKNGTAATANLMFTWSVT